MGRMQVRTGPSGRLCGCVFWGRIREIQNKYEQFGLRLPKFAFWIDEISKIIKFLPGEICLFQNRDEGSLWYRIPEGNDYE